jgi:hypothetical protein
MEFAHARRIIASIASPAFCTRRPAVHLLPIWLRRAAVAASACSTALLAWTLIDPTWIERWFDASPDGGDGTAERWLVGGGFFVAAALTAWLAWRQRRLAVA